MEEKDNLDRHLGDIFLGEIHIGNLSGLFQNLIIDTEISLNFVADEEGPKLYHYDRKKYYSISTTIKDCIFKNNVSIDNISNGIIFENCKFEKKLVINLKQAKNISYTKTDTDSQTGEPYEIVTNIDLSKEKIQVIGGKIETLEIEDSTFESKFYINAQDTDSNKKLEITKLIIKNTVFNQNFKLHNCNIDYITIEDTNFEKNADFFHTEIAKGSEQNYNDKTIPKNSIVFKSINFRGLAIFGDTEFQEKLVFKYVTFEGLSHFRNAKFYKGLDLDYSNIQEEMNFFNVSELNNTISKQNTSQETYRIIKHNFELIGNKIEANKYHALELEQKKNNLEDEIKKTTADKKIKLWFDSIVFDIHWISSEHSTNWILVLLWIIFVGLSTAILKSISIPILETINPMLLIIILLSTVFSFYIFKTKELKKELRLIIIILWLIIIALISLNISLIEITKSVSLINLFKLPEEEDISSITFFNKIALGYLYYQFLMSVRKDTRK